MPVPPAVSEAVPAIEPVQPLALYDAPVGKVKAGAFGFVMSILYVPRATAQAWLLPTAAPHVCAPVAATSLYEASSWSVLMTPPSPNAVQELLPATTLLTEPTAAST